MSPTPRDLDSVQALLTAHGETDIAYFRHHWPRFVTTQQQVLSTWDRNRGNVVLDVGAHWLHQSILYALDGFKVHAMDLPHTMTLTSVKSLAAAHDIELISNQDLSNPTGLAVLPDDSVDIVLFTEIIEHITFNPVAMWKAIYRVLKPGGRIVVTTPNYYAREGRAWDARRFVQRFGGGIDVGSILRQHTYAHHWKEFSLRELIYYFCVLSPDFNTVKALHLEAFVPPARRGLGAWLEARIPILRPNNHLEVELAAKRQGIVVEPQW